MWRTPTSALLKWSRLLTCQIMSTSHCLAWRGPTIVTRVWPVAVNHHSSWMRVWLCSSMQRSYASPCPVDIRGQGRTGKPPALGCSCREERGEKERLETMNGVGEVGKSHSPNMYSSRSSSRQNTSGALKCIGTAHHALLLPCSYYPEWTSPSNRLDKVNKGPSLSHILTLATHPLPHHREEPGAPPRKIHSINCKFNLWIFNSDFNSLVQN
jgi:hypothetical protein